VGSTRDTIKANAPDSVLRLSAWRREVWADLRLRLLAEVGHVPSHRVRNACYRASGLVLPPTSSIHWRAEFYAPERIVVGEHVIIGDSAFLDGRSGLTIGDNANLGSHVSIYTREHDVNSPSFAETGGAVVIGSRAWVSSHSVVLPGVTIGDGAVVAAGAIVTKDVASFTIVGGNPAKFIGQRNRELSYELGYAKRFV
jgi:maltose O-acetyltransferase